MDEACIKCQLYSGERESEGQVRFVLQRRCSHCIAGRTHGETGRNSQVIREWCECIVVYGCPGKIKS